MEDFNAAAQQFLSEPRIAVVGVSRSGQSPANFILKKFVETGHQAFAVNPNATEIDGRPCYADLRSIPGGVTAVFIATHPDVTPQIVRECAEAGVRRVWIHRGIGQGSASTEAERLGHQFGMEVLAGGCPLMFLEPVDIFHRCLRWYVDKTGKWKPEAEKHVAHTV